MILTKVFSHAINKVNWRLHKKAPVSTLLLTMSKSPRLYFSPIHFLWLPKGALFRKVLIRSGECILSMEKLSHYHNVSPARHHLGKWLKPSLAVITHFGFWTLLLMHNYSCSLTFNHRCGDHGECWRGHGMAPLELRIFYWSACGMGKNTW